MGLGERNGSPPDARRASSRSEFHSSLPRLVAARRAAALLVLLAAYFVFIAPAVAQTVQIWSATLNPKDIGGGTVFGCSSRSSSGRKCSESSVLSDNVVRFVRQRRGFGGGWKQDRSPLCGRRTPFDPATTRRRWLCRPSDPACGGYFAILRERCCSALRYFHLELDRPLLVRRRPGAAPHHRPGIAGADTPVIEPLDEAWPGRRGAGVGHALVGRSHARQFLRASVPAWTISGGQERRLAGALCMHRQSGLLGLAAGLARLTGQRTERGALLHVRCAVARVRWPIARRVRVPRAVARGATRVAEPLEHKRAVGRGEDAEHGAEAAGNGPGLGRRERARGGRRSRHTGDLRPAGARDDKRRRALDRAHDRGHRKTGGLPASGEPAAVPQLRTQCGKRDRVRLHDAGERRRGQRDHGDAQLVACDGRCVDCLRNRRIETGVEPLPVRLA